MKRTKSSGTGRSNRTSARARALAAAVMLAAATQSSAYIRDSTNEYTNPGSGLWTDAANWSLGLAPTTADHTIMRQGSATLGAGDIAAAGLFEMHGSSAVTMTGGQFTSVSAIRIGNSAGSNSTFTQSAGDTRIGNRTALWVGAGGTGTYTLNGGSLTIGHPTLYHGSDYGNLVVGDAAGGNGTLNINGGTLTNYALTQFARNGASATINMTGGTWNMAGNMGFGNLTGKVTFNHSGGTYNVGSFMSYPRSGATDHGALAIGLNTLNRSTYTISDSAVLNTNSHLYVGGGGGQNAMPSANNYGHGDLIMNGGTINVGGPNNPNYGNLYVGNAQTNTNSSGTVTLNHSSATLNVKAGVVLGSKQTGTGIGSGTLTVNAGKVLIGGELLVGRVNGTASGHGTVNLAGGLLRADSLTIVKPSAATPIQEFNWTGGDLEINRANLSYVLTNNGGTLRPGVTRPGAFALTGTEGSYSQSAAGALALDLAGDATYDSINATGGNVGAINLGGTVTATLGAGYAPGFGSTFAALAGKSVSDTATWNLPALPAGLAWDQRMISDTGSATQTKSISVAPASSTALAGGSWTGPGAVGASYALDGAGGSVSVDANVTAGYLQVGGAGNWSVDGGSTLTFSASSGRAGLLAFGNTTTMNAPVSFAGDGAIGTASAGTTVIVNGAVSGSGTIAKTGPGTLELKNGGSPFSGTWAISGGTLKIDSDANLGAAGAALRVDSATVSVNGDWNSARSIELQGAGMTVSASGNAGLSGLISGAGGLTHAGVNELTLSGANTYSGPTTVKGGILSAGAPNAIPSSSAVVLDPGSVLLLQGNQQTIGSLAITGTTNSAVLNTGGANLTAGGDNTSTVFRGNINGIGGGTFTKTGSGIMQITGVAAPTGQPANNAIDTQSIVVNGGILQLNALNRDTLTLPQAEIVVNAGAGLSLGGTGTSGALINSLVSGAGSLQFHGGTVELAQANTYTGPTEIRGGSTVVLGSMQSLSNSASPILIKPSSVVAAASSTNNSNNIKFNQSGTFSKSIVLEMPGTINLTAPGQVVTLDQPVTGVGVLSFGSGTFNLNAKNTNDGWSQAHVGTGAEIAYLKLGVDDAISNKQFFVINNGSTLDLNGHNQTLGTLVGNNGRVILSAGNTLTIGADNQDNDAAQSGQTWGFRGIITGAGGLTKIGGGQVRIEGKSDATNPPHSGPTHVKAGALRWDGDSRTINATSGITIDERAVMVFSLTNAASGATTPVIDVPISGGGTVQKNSLDDLELTATNTYTGGTHIRGGYLRINSDANIGAAPASVSPSNIKFHGGGGIRLLSQFDFHANRGVELLGPAGGKIDTNGFDSSLLGPIAGAGGFAKVGGGTLTIKSLNSGGVLDVQGGLLKVTGQSPATTIKAASVSVAAGTKLDLTSNNLIVSGTGLTGTWTGTAYDGVTGLVATGRNGGLWNGDGIVTTAATVGSNLTTLGVARVDDLGKVGLTFGGHTVAAGETIVMYTYGGDANLDGKVNIDDYGRIDANVSQSGTVFGWFNGDFNYDGKINIDDYGIIDSTVNSQGAPFPTGGSVMSVAAAYGVSAVPEPGSLGLLAAGSLAAFSRRRRN